MLRSLVSDVIGKYKRHGSTEPRYGPGTPKKLTDRKWQTLNCVVKGNRQSVSIEDSDRTMRREVLALHLVFMIVLLRESHSLHLPMPDVVWAGGNNTVVLRQSND